MPAWLDAFRPGVGAARTSSATSALELLQKRVQLRRSQITYDVTSSRRQASLPDLNVNKEAAALVSISYIDFVAVSCIFNLEVWLSLWDSTWTPARLLIRQLSWVLGLNWKWAPHDGRGLACGVCGARASVNRNHLFSSAVSLSPGIIARRPYQLTSASDSKQINTFDYRRTNAPSTRRRSDKARILGFHIKRSLCLFRGMRDRQPWTWCDKPKKNPKKLMVWRKGPWFDARWGATLSLDDCNLVSSHFELSTPFNCDFSQNPKST